MCSTQSIIFVLQFQTIRCYSQNIYTGPTANVPAPQLSQLVTQLVATEEGDSESMPINCTLQTTLYFFKKLIFPYPILPTLTTHTQTTARPKFLVRVEAAAWCIWGIAPPSHHGTWRNECNVSMSMSLWEFISPFHSHHWQQPFCYVNTTLFDGNPPKKATDYTCNRIKQAGSGHQCWIWRCSVWKGHWRRERKRSARII